MTSIKDDFEKRESIAIVNLIFRYLKEWKTTFREDNLIRRQLLITRNQHNLLCNNQMKDLSIFV
jgi:hypothetical protein